MSAIMEGFRYQRQIAVLWLFTLYYAVRNRNWEIWWESQCMYMYILIATKIYFLLSLHDIPNIIICQLYIVCRLANGHDMKIHFYLNHLHYKILLSMKINGLISIWHLIFFLSFFRGGRVASFFLNYPFSLL